MTRYKVTLYVDGVVEECQYHTDTASYLGFEEAIVVVMRLWEQSGHVVGDVLKVEVIQ
jgi:hypothetical protein